MKNNALKDVRLVFDSDCDTMFYQAKWNHWKPKKGGRHSIQAVYHYVDLLARNGVDTFAVNPNGQRAYYPSKAIPRHIEGYKRGDERFIYGHILGQPMTQDHLKSYLEDMNHWLDRYLDLEEAGVDWLAETAKACRRRGIRPWLTIRMNDMHGANSFAGSFMNAPLLAEERYRLRGVPLNSKEDPTHHMQALNFEKREVRDYMMRLIREVVEDYDYEGMELDWTRTAYCCNPVASPQATATITAWHRDIRALTRKQGRKNGRPYPLGLRIPGCLDFLKNVGLDVRGMAREGIVDFVAPTTTWQMSWDQPVDQWKAELGERVAILGVVEAGPNWIPGYFPKTKQRQFIRYLAASPAMMRGAAASKLALGADALETFNLFCTDKWEEAGCDYTALRNLSDIDFLRGKPKFYTLPTGPAVWSQPYFDYPEPMPAVLEPQCQRAFRIPMVAEPARPGTTLTVQAVVEGTDNIPDIGVSMNGSWPSFKGTRTRKLLAPIGRMTEHVPEYSAFNYTFPAGLIRNGWNEFVIANGSWKQASQAERKGNSVTVVSLELAVGN